MTDLIQQRTTASAVGGWAVCFAVALWAMLPELAAADEPATPAPPEAVATPTTHAVAVAPDGPPVDWALPRNSFFFNLGYLIGVTAYDQFLDIFDQNSLPGGQRTKVGQAFVVRIGADFSDRNDLAFRWTAAHLAIGRFGFYRQVKTYDLFVQEAARFNGVLGTAPGLVKRWYFERWALTMQASPLFPAWAFGETDNAEGRVTYGDGFVLGYEYGLGALVPLGPAQPVLTFDFTITGYLQPTSRRSSVALMLPADLIPFAVFSLGLQL